MNIHLFHHRNIIAKALSQLLRDKGYKVFLERENGFLQTKPLNEKSLLIVDIDSLLHMESYQEASLRNSEHNIVLLGSLQQLNWLFKFSSGLIGFICKTDKPQHLYRCIKKLENKESFISRKASNFIQKKKIEQQEILFGNCLIRPLTKTELKIMLEIGNGKTTKQIAENRNRSSHTVSNHRKNAKKKLKINRSFRLSKFCFKKINTIQTLIALERDKEYIKVLLKND